MSQATVFKNFVKVSNQDERFPSKACSAKYGKEEDWKCSIAQYAIEFLESKLLWIQPQYDSLVLKEFLQVSCLRKGSQMLTLAKCSSFERNFVDSIRAVN